jgi:hypothetical protein
MHSIRVEADDSETARNVVQSECQDDKCHCPPEWCTDDVQSEAVSARHVVLDGVTLITDEVAGLGTLYSDDSVQHIQVRGA